MITAIVTSDNHLGAYYARLRPDRLEQRRQAMQSAFKRVVDIALERHVDLFLHAGDLFDRPDPRNAERAFVARQIARLRAAGIEVVAIAGNHDGPRSLGTDGGTPPHEEWQALGAVHLIREARQPDCREFEVQGRPVRVWGMSSDWNLPRGACPLEPCFDDDSESPLWNGHTNGVPGASDGVDVVLLHYAVEGWADANWDEPLLSLNNLDRLRAEAICVGHLHKRNEMRLPGGALLLNPGATEHRHFGEESLECGCWLLHLEPGAAQAEYLPLTVQPMKTISIDLSIDLSLDSSEGDTDENNLSDLSPLMREALSRVEAASHDRQFLRVHLHGDISRACFQSLDLPVLQERGIALNFHCQLDTNDLRVCDADTALTVGFGVSFDAGEELQNTARAFRAEFSRKGDSDNEEICRLAAERLAASYDRLTGRAGQGV